MQVSNDRMIFFLGETLTDMQLAGTESGQIQSRGGMP